MALTDLAKFDPKGPVSLRDISLRQGISLVYLEQLFLKLKKNKIVKSVRGNKGGYILNKKASEINISEVFLAVEEKVKTIGCDKHSKKGTAQQAPIILAVNLFRFGKQTYDPEQYRSSQNPE